MFYWPQASNSKFINVIKSDIQEVIDLLKEDREIYGLIALIVCFVSLFANLNGYENKVSLTAYSSVMPLVVGLSLAVFSTCYFFILIARREPRPLRCYGLKLRLCYQFRTRIFAVLILLTALSTFISSYSTMKSMIPLLHPFAFDELFHQIDYMLLLDNEPWVLFHSLFDSPFITAFVNFNYNAWFFLLWGVLCYFLLSPTGSNRSRYLVSWILCWFLLGSVLAMLLSSAGPVFMVRLNPEHQQYVGLMELLQAHNSWLKEQGSPVLIWALNTQNVLWESYITGKDTLGSGISAMPSMHVSMAVLMALGMYSVNKRIGLIFWVYALVIYIGSFTLAWHYAIDGLVSAPLTILIWYLVGKSYPTKPVIES